MKVQRSFCKQNEQPMYETRFCWDSIRLYFHLREQGCQYFRSGSTAASYWSFIAWTKRRKM